MRVKKCIKEREKEGKEMKGKNKKERKILIRTKTMGQMEVGGRM